MQTCDQTCAYCAREAWRWVKAREANMRQRPKGGGQSFAEAAATSVRPPSP